MVARFGKLTLLFLLLSIHCFAQTERVFIVKKKSKVYLTPDVDTLVAGAKYYFAVKGMEQKDLAPGQGYKETSGADGSWGISIKLDSNKTGKFLLQLEAKDGIGSKVVYKKSFTVISASSLVPQVRFGSQRVNTSQIVFSKGIPSSGASSYVFNKDSLITTLSRLLVLITPSSFKSSKLQVAIAMRMDCQGNKTYYTSNKLQLSDNALKAIVTMQKNCTFSIQDVRFYDNTVPNNDMHFGPYNFTLK